MLKRMGELNDQKCMVSKNNGMHPYVNARFNRNLPCSPDEKSDREI